MTETPARWDSTGEPKPQIARELTSGIVHELNNVLTVVRTYTHFARQPTTAERSAGDLKVVAAAAERASALVDWLASQSEETPRAADELSANDFVSAICARLEQLIPTGTTIEIMRVSADVSFRADALRLEHVVTSLVLAESQRFAARAFAFSIEQTQGLGAQQLNLAEGSYAVIVIACTDATKESDWQGRLIARPDQLLALAAPLHDLLRTMNGKLEFIRVGEEQDRFEIYLPVVPATLHQPLRPRLALAPPSANTVCIIEDELAIRLAMLRTLSGAGYFVLEANDSLIARQLLIQHGPAVRLLICDVGALRDGEEFFSWIKATCPSAAVLLISGNERAGEAKASSLRAQFLGKPFTPSELVSAARQTIARADAALRGISSMARLVVLVVDDEEVIRDSFARLLAECDFETVVASSAIHALRILEERHVDAVVTDQFMPGLNGIDLLELVHQRAPDCIRILCTAHAASDLVINAVNKGRVHRVLPKNMHAVALRDEIERVVLEGMQQHA